jgi:hypothetical protein
MNIQVSCGSLRLAFNENSHISLKKQEFYVSLMDQYVSVIFFFTKNVRTVNFCGFGLLTEGEILTRPVMQESLTNCVGYDKLLFHERCTVAAVLKASDTVPQTDCFISLKS